MPDQKILILSRPDDIHYQVVHHGLSQASIASDLVSYNNFPQYDTHTYCIDENSEIYTIKCNNGSLIQPDQYDVVWNHRAVSAVVSPELSNADSLVAVRELSMFVEGIKLVCATRQRWVNDPVVERNVGQKPYQLHMARQCGLLIPKTIMTNSSISLERFLSNNSLAILKTFYPVTWHSGQDVNMAYAALISHADRIDLSASVFTSNLVQGYIEKDFELRIFYFDGEIISVLINSQESKKSTIDWRAQFDGSLKVEIFYDLPDQVINGIKRFASLTSLQYGAFDFFFGKDGRFYFLECNPSGQFLFMEEWNPSIRLTSAFLRLLTKDLTLSPLQQEILRTYKLMDMLSDTSASRFYEKQSSDWPKVLSSTFHYHDDDEANLKTD